MENQYNEFLYKILVVGDIGTGKTSIIKRYVHGIFSIHYKSTIGVDFSLKVIKFDDDTTIKLQLWDIAGQERFNNMTRVYYKDAIGAVVVYDVTRFTTRESVIQWKHDIDSKLVFPGTDIKIPTILIANKNDLLSKEDDDQYITKDGMDKFCKEHGFVTWFSTSVKNNTNINEAFNTLIESIMKMQSTVDNSIITNKQDTITLDNHTVTENKCSCY